MSVTLTLVRYHLSLINLDLQLNFIGTGKTFCGWTYIETVFIMGWVDLITAVLMMLAVCCRYKNINIYHLFCCWAQWTNVTDRQTMERLHDENNSCTDGIGCRPYLGVRKNMWNFLQEEQRRLLVVFQLRQERAHSHVSNHTTQNKPNEYFPSLLYSVQK